jgi:hypothetical protein
LQNAICLSIDMKIALSELLPVAAILMKLFMVIQSNATRIFCLNVDYKAKEEVNTVIANSLNLASSLVNHSCDPNMFKVAYGTTVVFRAMRPISKGEQLTFSYSKLAINSSYKYRQDDLRQTYKFTCT